MRVVGEVGERLGAHVAAAAVRAEDIPLQVEQAAAGGVQEQAQHLQPGLAPAIGQGERAHTQDIGVVGAAEMRGEPLDQRRPDPELAQPIGRDGDAVGVHDRLAARRRHNLLGGHRERAERAVDPQQIAHHLIPDV